LYRGVIVSGCAENGGAYVEAVLAGLRFQGQSQSNRALLSAGAPNSVTAIPTETTSHRVFHPIIASLPWKEMIEYFHQTGLPADCQEAAPGGRDVWSLFPDRQAFPSGRSVRIAAVVPSGAPSARRAA
jgi:hypothetical protein